MKVFPQLISELGSSHITFFKNIKELLLFWFGINGFEVGKTQLRKCFFRALEIQVENYSTQIEDDIFVLVGVQFAGCI